MAKSSKSKTSKSKNDKAAEPVSEVDTDAVSEPVQPQEVGAEIYTDVTDIEVADDIAEDIDQENLSAGASTEASIAVVTDEEVAQAEANDQAYTDVDSVEESASGSAPPPVQATPQSSAGFFPLLLGGVAAGAIGYGIATYFPMNTGSDDLVLQLEAQADQIAALETKLAETPTVDLSGVESQIAELGEQTTAQTSELASNLDGGLTALDERLIEVEKRPGGDGTLSDVAVAAYQRELEELRADLDAQQANVMSAAAQAEADLAAARAEAEVLEQEAIAAAEAAAARAALNRVSAAVETGAPFAAALGDLDAADLPAALVDAAEGGVATTAQLTSEFPAAARAALATARAEGVSGESGGLGGFLRNQFDVRSTAPQEGPGPDAVLSRAEAAIKDGRVVDALAEIEALPEVARAEMTDWTAKATERADVLDAIATLSETYN